MQAKIKKLLYLTLVCGSYMHGITPFLSFRSQGVNAARELVGWTDKINLSNKESFYGSLYGLFEYTRSFSPNQITTALFGADLVCDTCFDTPSIVISGSQTTDRQPTDWLADYFGLSTDFKSVITFKPLVQNFVVDFNFYFGLDDWCPGLYFRVDAPIVNTKWNINLDENIITPGANTYPAGYFSQSQENVLYANFTDYANGGLTEMMQSGSFDTLANAKLSSNSLEQTNLAELRAAVGWNHTCDDWHAGFNIRVAAPAGTKPKGQFAFEPIVGNGHHWEAGVGLTGHWTFWHGDCEDQSMGLYTDANITHMFKARQHRTFDLKDKPNSRYMLAQKITAIDSTALADVGTPFLASPPFPLLASPAEFSPVANLTTFDIDSNVAIQADWVVLFNYKRGPLSLDFGYNFWARTCENISVAGQCPPPLLDGSTWALKGDASVAGKSSAGFVALAATESNATIHAGTNFPAAGTTDPAAIRIALSNPKIDTPMPAVDNSGNPVNVISASPPLQINSSLDPLFLSMNDIDYAGTSGYSNKIFAHFNYTWIDITSWTPFLGVGGEVEFGHASQSACGSCTTSASSSCATNDCNTSCTDCQGCALSQWGIWIKGGISFNT